MKHTVVTFIAGLALGLCAAFATPAFALTAETLKSMTVQDIEGEFERAAEALREIVSFRKTGHEFKDEFEGEKQALVEEKDAIRVQKDEYRELYKSLNEEIGQYAEKCGEEAKDKKTFDDCTAWFAKLEPRKTEIDEGYARLVDRMTAHDMKIDDLKSRETARIKKMEKLEDHMVMHQNSIRMIETELDDRSWNGCIDNALCQRTARAQYCTGGELPSEDCVAQCLQSVIDDTEWRGCTR